MSQYDSDWTPRDFQEDQPVHREIQIYSVVHQDSAVFYDGETIEDEPCDCASIEVEGEWVLNLEDCR